MTNDELKSLSLRSKLTINVTTDASAVKPAEFADYGTLDCDLEDIGISWSPRMIGDECTPDGADGNFYHAEPTIESMQFFAALHDYIQGDTTLQDAAHTIYYALEAFVEDYKEKHTYVLNSEL